MALAAQATRAELQQAFAALGAPAFDELRPAEAGLVMVRGRIGGDGGAFNLGEATVSRAAVRLATGETGFSYSLGRDLDRARLAAVLDAALQAGRYDEIEQSFVAPVSARLARESTARAERVAATRVDFFTMVRGEDQA